MPCHIYALPEVREMAFNVTASCLRKLGLRGTHRNIGKFVKRMNTGAEIQTYPLLKILHFLLCNTFPSISGMTSLFKPKVIPSTSWWTGTNHTTSQKLPLQPLQWCQIGDSSSETQSLDGDFFPRGWDPHDLGCQNFSVVSPQHFIIGGSKLTDHTFSFWNSELKTGKAEASA